MCGFEKACKMCGFKYLYEFRDLCGFKYLYVFDVLCEFDDLWEFNNMRGFAKSVRICRVVWICKRAPDHRLQHALQGLTPKCEQKTC